MVFRQVCNIFEFNKQLKCTWQKYLLTTTLIHINNAMRSKQHFRNQLFKGHIKFTYYPYHPLTFGQMVLKWQSLSLQTYPQHIVSQIYGRIVKLQTNMQQEDEVSIQVDGNGQVQALKILITIGTGLGAHSQLHGNYRRPCHTKEAGKKERDMHFLGNLRPYPKQSCLLQHREHARSW